MTTKTVSPSPAPSATILVQQFLQEHHIKTRLSVWDGSATLVDNGFILSKEPLLKLTYEYEKE